MEHHHIFRKFVLPVVIFLAACTGEPHSRAKDNEASVAAMFERGWSRGETEVFSATIADMVVFHYAGTPYEMTNPQMKEIVLRWREAFPDLHVNIDDMISEGDTVAARMTLTGTHNGTWRGVAPTGRKVRMALMMFFRFEDGRLVELWESDDQLGLQKQLGLRD